MTEQKRPEISIIVPVYKVEQYLNECHPCPDLHGL